LLSPGAKDMSTRARSSPVMEKVDTPERVGGVQDQFGDTTGNSAPDAAVPSDDEYDLVGDFWYLVHKGMRSPYYY